MKRPCRTWTSSSSKSGGSCLASTSSWGWVGVAGGEGQAPLRPRPGLGCLAQEGVWAGHGGQGSDGVAAPPRGSRQWHLWAQKRQPQVQAEIPSCGLTAVWPAAAEDGWTDGPGVHSEACSLLVAVGRAQIAAGCGRRALWLCGGQAHPEPRGAAREQGHGPASWTRGWAGAGRTADVLSAACDPDSRHRGSSRWWRGR